MNTDLLNDLKDYFEDRADADHSGESYRPNKEMQLFSALNEYTEDRAKVRYKLARYLKYKNFEEMDPREKDIANFLLENI